MDLEVIVSDDCSPRVLEIKDVLKKYRDNEKVKIFYQDKNLGEQDNKNFLIGHAKGQYNIILGDDDYLEPTALTKLRDYIVKYPSVDLFGFGYKIVDELRREIVTYSSGVEVSISRENRYLAEKTLDALVLPLWIFHPATFCCRSGIEREYRYKLDVGIGEDLFFIFECLINGKIIKVLPEVIFNWQKYQGKEAGLAQINQSLGYKSNYAARKKIFYKLERIAQKEAQGGNLYGYILSPQYRERFLYDAIFLDRQLEMSDYRSLDLDGRHKQELLNESHSLNGVRRRLYIECKKVFSIIKILGIFQGSLLLLKVLASRIKYRFVSYVH